jgi:hypothetical protein
VLGAAAVVLALLWSPAIRGSRAWRATVTPLASIIGSGFLVVAPLLAYTAGNWAMFAMLGIVMLAYAVGAAVRYNIAHLETLADAKQSNTPPQEAFKWLERTAKIALALAYIIAITFYLELLAAFALRLFDIQDMVWQKLFATGLLLCIGGIGYWRGLGRLELLENYSVDIKLAIIIGFLAGLAIVNADRLVAGTWALSRLPVEWSVETIRKLLGAFLIVQGFETSRYMGSAYRPDERVRTMRYAQLISAAIYLAFIALASVLFGSFGSISETGIIALSQSVAVIAPFMLVIGAVMAQFSAAVADTLASGGLVEAATYEKVTHRAVYVAVTLLAVGLLWSSHILEIIAYASRAFAGYYAIQCAMAALHAGLTRSRNRDLARIFLYAVLALAMLLTMCFGIPAESVGS